VARCRSGGTAERGVRLAGVSRLAQPPVNPCHFQPVPEHGSAGDLQVQRREPVGEEVDLGPRLNDRAVLANRVVARDQLGSVDLKSFVGRLRQLISPGNHPGVVGRADVTKRVGSLAKEEALAFRHVTGVLHEERGSKDGIRNAARADGGLGVELRLDVRESAELRRREEKREKGRPLYARLLGQSENVDGSPMHDFVVALAMLHQHTQIDMNAIAAGECRP
jgi:hypothetical protein